MRQSTIETEKDLPVGTVIKLRHSGAGKHSLTVRLAVLLALGGILVFVAFYNHAN